MGWAMVTPEAVPDIIAICFSGKHGKEVCQAIISEMRPHSVLIATSSMTLEQIAAWIDVEAKAKKTTASRAVNAAMESGGLYRVFKGKKGTASVYTFGAYVHNAERGNVNETDALGTQIGVIGTQTDVDRFTNDPSFVHNAERGNVDYPYPSISTHIHPQDGSGSDKERKHPKYEQPTYEQYAGYCSENGYTLNAAEFRDMEERGFTDYDGEPIKYWRAWIDKLHADDAGGTVVPKARGTVQCPECGHHVTVTLQDDGTYSGGCQECRIPVTATTEQLVKRV